MTWMQPAEVAATAHHSLGAIDVLRRRGHHPVGYWNLVGLQDLEAFTRSQLVPPLAQFLGRTRRRVQTIVELAIAGFDQGLVQITLGEIARQIIGRKGRGPRARQRDRCFTTLSSGLGRHGVGTRRHGRRIPKADEKAHGQEIVSAQAKSTRSLGTKAVAKIAAGFTRHIKTFWRGAISRPRQIEPC